jgi:hypothetical protein
MSARPVKAMRSVVGGGNVLAVVATTETDDSTGPVDCERSCVAVVGSAEDEPSLPLQAAAMMLDRTASTTMAVRVRVRRSGAEGEERRADTAA